MIRFQIERCCSRSTIIQHVQLITLFYRFYPSYCTQAWHAIDFLHIVLMLKTLKLTLKYIYDMYIFMFIYMSKNTQEKYVKRIKNIRFSIRIYVFYKPHTSSVRVVRRWY